MFPVCVCVCGCVFAREYDTQWPYCEHAYRCDTCGAALKTVCMDVCSRVTATCTVYFANTRTDVTHAAQHSRLGVQDKRIQRFALSGVVLDIWTSCVSLDLVPSQYRASEVCTRYHITHPHTHMSMYTTLNIRTQHLRTYECTQFNRRELQESVLLYYSPLSTYLI